MIAPARKALKTRVRIVLCLLGGAIVAASFAAAASAGRDSTTIDVIGNRDADAPIVADLERRLPAASEIFVNCPEGNRIVIEAEPEGEPPIPKGRGFQCEYRVEIGDEIVNGQDQVEKEPAQPTGYRLTFIGVPGRAPDSWQSCTFAHKTVRKEITGRNVSLRGTYCGFSSRQRVEEIELLTVEPPYRPSQFEAKKLPSRFGLGDRDGKAESEFGFVVERFDCSSRTQPIAGSRVHIFVTCTTRRFGDAIELEFDEPAPVRRRR